MCDLFDESIFEEKLRRLAMGFQKRFGDLLKYDVEEEIARYKVCMSCGGLDEGLTSYRTSARKSLPTSSTRSPYLHRRRRRKPRSWSRAQML